MMSAARRRCAASRVAALVLAGFALPAVPAVAGMPVATAAPVVGCDGVAGAHLLDFWFGTWEVREANGTLAGRDVVRPILHGCAVEEVWHGVDAGDEGQSLFLFDAFSGRWRQTWVTTQATQRGGLKYKDLVAHYPGGGVRFQGLLPGAPSAATILDRTTLSPLPDHRVHQVIAVSRDGGDTWQVTFDAIYRKTGSRGGAEFSPPRG